MTIPKLNTGTANFLSGGFASLVFWVFAIPADNIKKYVSSYLQLHRPCLGPESNVPN